MAGSVNKVIFLGHLGADPEVRFTPGGQAVCNFRLAASESWSDKNTGQKQERTEWARVVVWGKLAELCGEYLKKGRQAYVEGSLQTREYQDKEGVKRHTTEIKAREVVFLGGGDRQQGGGSRGSDYGSGYSDPGGSTDAWGNPPNEDIPF